eukprot:1814733-Karenia_brevis.AAC.1
MSRLAISAQTAAEIHDYRASFEVVRRLSGKHSVLDKSIKLKDGTTAASEEQRQLRWQEHFCDFFRSRHFTKL